MRSFLYNYSTSKPVFVSLASRTFCQRRPLISLKNHGDDDDDDREDQKVMMRTMMMILLMISGSMMMRWRDMIDNDEDDSK